MLARLVRTELRLTFTLDSFDLCADVYGVEADTVLLTVDGAPLTAEQLVYPLSVWLQSNWNEGLRGTYLAEQTLNQLVDLAVEKAAGTTLLGQLGETLEPWEGASALAGCLGVTEAGWQWERDRQQVSFQLGLRYALEHNSTDHRDPDFYQNVLSADLSALMEGITVERTDALTGLDLTDAHSRLADSPFAVGATPETF